MRVPKPILGALLVLLVMAFTEASATGDATAVRVQPDCDPAGLVTQSITGRVSACLRLGNVAAGGTPPCFPGADLSALCSRAARAPTR